MVVCDTDAAKGSGRSFRLVCQAGQRELVEAFLAATVHVAEAEPFSPWCRRIVAEPTALGASLAARFGGSQALTLWKQLEQDLLKPSS